MRVPLSATVRPREKKEITKQKSFELDMDADQILYDLGATVVVEDGEVFRAKDDDIERALGVASKAEVFGDTSVGDWLKMVIEYPTNEYMGLLLKAKKDAENGEAESKYVQSVEPEKGVAEAEGGDERGVAEAKSPDAERGAAEAKSPEAEKGAEGENGARPVEAEKGAVEGEELEAAAAIETGGGADSVEAVTDDIHPLATGQATVMEYDQLMAGLWTDLQRVVKSRVQLKEEISATYQYFANESRKLDKFHRDQYERLKAHIAERKKGLSGEYKNTRVPYEARSVALANDQQQIQYDLRQLDKARQRRLLDEGGRGPPPKRLCVQGQSKVWTQIRYPDLSPGPLLYTLLTRNAGA